MRADTLRLRIGSVALAIHGSLLLLSAAIPARAVLLLDLLHLLLQVGQAGVARVLQVVVRRIEILAVVVQEEVVEVVYPLLIDLAAGNLIEEDGILAATLFGGLGLLGHQLAVDLALPLLPLGLLPLLSVLLLRVAGHRAGVLPLRPLLGHMRVLRHMRRVSASLPIDGGPGRALPHTEEQFVIDELRRRQVADAIVLVVLLDDLVRDVLLLAYLRFLVRRALR